jgi:hypothetical protein
MSQFCACPCQITAQTASKSYLIIDDLKIWQRFETLEAFASEKPKTKNIFV